MSDSDACSVQSAGTDDAVINRINQLKELVEIGVIKKVDLLPMIKAIYLGCSAGSSASSPAKSETKNITKVLQSSRSFRRAASPETCKIRQIVEGPIVRRFELQCAKPDSVLFGQVPPKRLREAVFNVACEEPLEQIYINNAKQLAKVPSSKVISVIKWKVRKMRGNLVKHGIAKQGLYHDDGFDWKAAAKMAPRKIKVEPTPRRQHVWTPRKRNIIELTSSDEDSSTEEDPAFARSPKSAFSVPPKTPSPRNVPADTKRKCGKCGLLSVPYPLDMDWTSNTSAVPYCKKCFTSLERQCDELTLKPKNKRRKKSTVNTPTTKVFTIMFDVFVVLSVLYRCFSTPPSCLLMKLCFIHLFPLTQNVREGDDQIKVGMKVQSSGVRWKLPETEMYHGVIISKRRCRGVMTYKVKWEEDGVVERITTDQIRSMITV